MAHAATSRRERHVFAWLIFLLAMEFFAVMFAGGGVHDQFDFQEYYTAGSLMRSHPSQLYNLASQERVQRTHAPHASFLPFYHPAYEAILFVPLSSVSYTAAYLSFIICNTLLLLASFLVLGNATSPDLARLKSEPLLLLLFLPIVMTVVIGQDSILLLLLYCLTWRELEAKNDMKAGFLAALALFKFQIAIPIALLIALRRSWKFSAGFVIVAAAIVSLCIGIVGVGGTLEYVRLMSGAVSAIGTGSTPQHGMNFYRSAMTNLAGLLYGCGARFLHSSFAFNALIAVCSFGLFAWCAKVIRSSEAQVAFSIAILCGLLVSYHSFLYDMTLAILATGLLAGRTNKYILMALYGVPVFLLPFGAKWFFPSALPVLAMLIYTLVFSPRSSVDSAAPLQAAAI
jgi:hypothetical protein